MGIMPAKGAETKSLDKDEGEDRLGASRNLRNVGGWWQGEKEGLG